MRIASIGVSFPTLKVTNEDLLEKLTQFNPGLDPAVLSRNQRILHQLLRRAGSRTRYYRNRESGETAPKLISQACEEALQQAGMQPADLQLLIFCGVGRAFLEPAMAYFVARNLGASCECFDVVDACMSWVRALHLADSLFRAGRYSNALIVNGEFNIYEHGYPELLKLSDCRQLEYTFPAFTIGEAATATVLTNTDSKWRFEFRTFPEYVELCTLPLAGYQEYLPVSKKIGRNGEGHFTSFGDELTNRAAEQLERFICDRLPAEDVDIWFPHAASAEICRLVTARLKPPGKVYWEVFSNYGNLASASIPAAMYMAARDGVLRRGHRVVLCPASAGMSLALAEFNY